MTFLEAEVSREDIQLERKHQDNTNCIYNFEINGHKHAASELAFLGDLENSNPVVTILPFRLEPMRTQLRNVNFSVLLVHSTVRIF